MAYNLKSSLEKRALVKISSILWSQRDINAELDKILFLRSFDIQENFKEIEEKVMQKIKKLPELGEHKKKILGFVRSMGRQIFRWIMQHSLSIIATNNYVRVHAPSFSWTPYGTIDKKETARIMINDQTLEPAMRYKLAHIYCLEGNVQEIWDSISSDCKDPIYETRGNPGVINEFDLVFLWSNISGVIIVEADPQQNQIISRLLPVAFEEAVQSCNIVAAAYFLQKLSLEEKDTCLVQAAQYSFDAEVLCFLLSQLDEDQRTRVFQRDPKFILRRFYEWPWVSLYPEIAFYYWQASTDKYCLFPLIFFIEIMNNIDYEKVACQKIFSGLWQCISEEFGTDVDSSTKLLRSVFLVKDKSIIKMIFRDASLAIKKAFIEDSPVIIMNLIKENDEELFQFLIQECELSQNEITELKADLKIILNFSTKTRAEYNSLADKIDEFFFMLESVYGERRYKKFCRKKGK